MKKLLLRSGFCYAALSVFSLLLAMSCEPTCGPGDNLQPDLQGMTGDPVQLAYGSSGISALQQAANDTLPFDEVGLHLTAAIEWLSHHERTGIPMAAYACDPIPPQFEETIAGIYLFSDADYDAFTPAGDTLNAVFDVIYQSFAEAQFWPVDLTTFLSTRPSVKDQLYLLPKSPPAQRSTHRFRVHYYLTNGEFYEVVFAPVTIGV